MKRLFLFLFILLNAFLLCSCGRNKNINETDEIMKYKIEAALTNGYDDTHFIPYEYELVTKDDMFDVDNTKYNQDIAKLALCIDNTNSIRDEGGDFDKCSYYLEKCLKTMSFKYYLSPNYNQKPTKDSVGYVIANKTCRNYDLIVLSVRGNNYYREWVNNLTIGNGNVHEGIKNHANELYEVLKAYLTYNHFDNPKLLISGFSRGGMIANTLGGLVVDNNDLNVNSKDIFVYTFNAPGCFAKNDAKYNNIFNLYSSNDLIQNFTKAFGFERLGTDINIYQEEVFKNIHTVNPDLNDYDSFRVAKANIGLGGLQFSYDEENDMSPTEWIEFVFKTLLIGNEGIDARNFFLENYQVWLCDLANIVFDDTSKIKPMMEFVKNNVSALNLISMLTNYESFYTFVKETLEYAEISFDYGKLADDTLIAHNTIKLLLTNGKLSDILDIIGTVSLNGDVIFANHVPESCYYLLKNYDKSN